MIFIMVANDGLAVRKVGMAEKTGLQTEWSMLVKYKGIEQVNEEKEGNLISFLHWRNDETFVSNIQFIIILVMKELDKQKTQQKKILTCRE